jgi:hypothetical protein
MDTTPIPVESPTRTLQRSLIVLQRRRTYPSVTVLVTTPKGVVPDAATIAVAQRLIEQADERLRSDVDDSTRIGVVGQLRELLGEQTTVPGSTALALCVSPEMGLAVHLGREVNDRVVIDDTFATRDLVADVNRIAEYQVFTVSDHMVRRLVGDRRRLEVDLSPGWPLLRDDEHTTTTWRQAAADAIRTQQRQDPAPTVVAGVQRTLQRIAGVTDRTITIGSISGNHDRTNPSQLHRLAWPIVTDWLRRDRVEALEQLDAARSSRRYAGGIHEIWPLANDGRIELLVVEDTYAIAARTRGDIVEPTDDPTAPDVVDDLVDETIEAVMRHGGRTIIVAEGDLADEQHIAAALRF